MTTVILKVTEACNARCAYCDVVRKPRPAVTTMSHEVLEQLFVRTDEFLREHPEEVMCLVWHGGEPLLVGTGYYSAALEYQRRHCPTTAARLRHSIQTNATLMTRDFVPVLAALGIEGVGTSYDPEPGLRGLGRERDSRRYDEQFMEGLQVLQEAGMSWGMIYVVTRRSLARPLDAYRFCLNLATRGAVRLNPVLLFDDRDPEVAGLGITEEEWVEFQGAIFPTWFRERHRYPDVEPFAAAVRNVSALQHGSPGSRKLGCMESGECARSHFNLAPDGALSLCGRAADWGLLDHGSIMERSFSEVLADPARQDLLARSRRLAEAECEGCRFFEICHGGCPLDGWAATGDLMRRTGWCASTRAFLERFVEPALGVPRPAPPRTAATPAPPPPAAALRGTQVPEVEAALRLGLPPIADGPCWINPTGGYGDVLMLSGVLRQVIEREPARRFRLVRRTKYIEMLRDHPAIAEVGHPPPGAVLRSNNYWDHPAMARPGARAYQCLAEMFGLPTPVPETLWVPWEEAPDPELTALVPWRERNVLISSSSDSPRKCWDWRRWEELVAALRARHLGVVQVGRHADRFVRGAFGLLGLTTPRQLLSLLPRFDAVVCVDSFLMHAAHLKGLPAVVIWGPTDHRVLGYPEHVHLQGVPEASCLAECLGPANRHLYGSPCPLEAGACANDVTVAGVLEAVTGILGEAPARPLPPPPLPRRA